MQPAILNDPAIYPPPAVRARLYLPTEYDTAYQRLLTRSLDADQERAVAGSGLAARRERSRLVPGGRVAALQAGGTPW